MKYQVITLNGKPAIVKTADMDGETLKKWAYYAPFTDPFGTNKSIQLFCEKLNNGILQRQDFSWSKNDTNPVNPL